MLLHKTIAPGLVGVTRTRQIPAFLSISFKLFHHSNDAAQSTAKRGESIRSL